MCAAVPPLSRSFHFFPWYLPFFQRLSNIRLACHAAPMLAEVHQDMLAVSAVGALSYKWLLEMSGRCSKQSFIDWIRLIYFSRHGWVDGGADGLLETLESFEDIYICVGWPGDNIGPAWEPLGAVYHWHSPHACVPGPNCSTHWYLRLRSSTIGVHSNSKSSDRDSNQREINSFTAVSWSIEIQSASSGSGEWCVLYLVFLAWTLQTYICSVPCVWTKVVAVVEKYPVAWMVCRTDRSGRPCPGVHSFRHWSVWPWIWCGCHGHVHTPTLRQTQPPAQVTLYFVDFDRGEWVNATLSIRIYPPPLPFWIHTWGWGSSHTWVGLKLWLLRHLGQAKRAIVRYGEVLYWHSLSIGHR